MTRQQYRDLAGRIAQTLVALEEKPQETKGAVMVALMIADVIEQEGKMGARAFLRSCGIEPGKKRGKALQVDAEAALFRWVDGLDVHDVDGDEEPLRPAQLSS
jgi:hypothetical protein